MCLACVRACVRRVRSSLIVSTAFAALCPILFAPFVVFFLFFMFFMFFVLFLLFLSFMGRFVLSVCFSLFLFLLGFFFFFFRCYVLCAAVPPPLRRPDTPRTPSRTGR